ncbi:LytR/AlgR family response regulator transcription factor [Jiulongibacter sp. NS-SX5]|uniref:LytR/AlgR family response regulator transcription factor n=1 Tax=Jiulongibacter sp. NS-SX5 TaxID=3463854 RepID=UPI004057EBA1
MKYKFENVRGFKQRRLQKKDIVMIEGDENYSIFHLTSGTKFTLAKTLKQCESIFADVNFIRSHRSFIVNLDHCKSFGSTEVRLTNKLTAKISRRRAAFLYSQIS